MRTRILNPKIMLFLFFIFVLMSGCKKKTDNSDKPASDTWDIDKSGIPKFVGTNYIELDKIYRISKFRSSIGHDYSDAFEHCRSMKHYFEPKSDLDWSTIKIYSPVTGTITRVDEEWAGTKLEIASDDYPAFRFSIFHINMSVQRNIGDKLMSGTQLGTHIGSQTTSDIAVTVNDPTKQGRLISYFEVLTDAIFSTYSNRAVSNREAMIIPKETRDANPLICSGDTLIATDTLENWIVLK
jgi:hypothetical protein